MNPAWLDPMFLVGRRVQVLSSHMFAIQYGMVGVITGRGPKECYAVKFEGQPQDVALWRKDFEVIDEEK